MPHAWLRLVDAVGGVDTLAKELGVTRMTLWRMANERTKPTNDVRYKIEMIAKREGVPVPFKPSADRKANVRFLELVGQGIMKGHPIPRKTLDEGRRRFTNEHLVKLAETSESPEILTAVTFFLESD